MDKPAAGGTPFFALPDHALLTLEGRDAIAFAQAQCMSDVAALADGQWQWSGWLSPKGRVQALFALLRVGPETLWLLLPDGDAAALAAALQRFVFRSKVKLDVPARAVCGAFAPPATASGATTATTADGTVEFDFGDGQRPRTLRICADCTAAPDEAAQARWRAWDIAHGLPRPGAATLEAWTPQQLSLDRLRAYSVRKGCYPGQEIVARTHFLGQAKRGLALLGGVGVAESGADVMQEERALGKVVCAAPVADPDSLGLRTTGADGTGATPPAALVLAVVPVDQPADAQPLQVAGMPLAALPLLDGLAR